MKKGKIISIIVLAVIFCITAYLGFSAAIDDFEAWLPKAINPDGEIGEFFYSFTVLGDTLLDVVLIAEYLPYKRCLPPF